MFRAADIVTALERRCIPALIAGAALLGLSCHETLPDYHSPGNVLTVTTYSYEQLNDHVAPPNHPLVHIVVTCQNIHDEVFWDSVDVHGTMRIWWKRKPSRFRTLPITDKNFSDRSLIHNGKLLLVPGQTFSLDCYWDMRTDYGMFVPEEMDWTNPNQKYCAANVYCAPAEIFVVEVTLNVYDRLGSVTAPSHEITIIARSCVCNGFPPCGVGGCP
jgi:hypothetical protein